MSSMLRSGSVVVALALLVGCSANTASSPVAPQTTAAPALTDRATAIIRIATGTGTASAAKRRAYTSPAQESIKVVVYSDPSNGTAVETKVANLTPGSSGCSNDDTSAPGYPGTVCDVDLDLNPGNYEADVETFPETNAHGVVLSVQDNVTFTVPANNGGNPKVIPWTLYGVPAKLVMSPHSSSVVVSGSTFSLYDNTPQAFALFAYDPTGAHIVGAGAPGWKLSSSNSGYTIVEPTSSSPNTVTVEPTKGTGPSTTTLTLDAVDPTDGTTAGQSQACHFAQAQESATCSLTLTMNVLDTAADDWTTFDHDYQRTGYEAQATGISASNAGSLALRWHVQVPQSSAAAANEIYASPVVYKGNVIVVTDDPAVVYDYSAINGALLWSRSIGNQVYKAPTIDPATGLVLVGNRIIEDYKTQPGQYFALNLSDGSIAWQTTVLGLTRGPDVVVNGVDYVPSSGGDPSQCLNTGITALDLSNGSTKWNWYVNQTTNPGGGGSVWGALAYDGKDLIFGTGNVCQEGVPTADGVAAITLAGKTDWSFVAWAQTGSGGDTEDYDTGSGVTVTGAGTSSETASFLNKNGSFYRFNTSALHSSSPSATLEQQIVVNSQKNAYFDSPSTDGTVTMINAGLLESSSSSSVHRRLPTVDYMSPRYYGRTYSASGYYSQLDALNSAGQIIWHTTMNNTMVGYSAITNGVVFADVDDTLVAYNAQTGAKLWSYAAPSLLYASPVVVPSGLYFADSDGNVYAFGPPPATTAPSSERRRPVEAADPADLGLGDAALR